MRFADDVELISSSLSELQNMIIELQEKRKHEKNKENHHQFKCKRKNYW